MADQPQPSPPILSPGFAIVQQAGLRSPQYREIYATGFAFRATMSDFSIVFLSLSSPPGALNVVLNQEETAVTMTLPILKAFSENLSAAVKQLEDRLGPIKVDTRMRPDEARMTALFSGIDLSQMKE